MIKSKTSHKLTAVFFTLSILMTIIPVNYLFANNNGPGSPEAAGFEPVDATDMVNLSTGDLSYVLPLMSVEGFPINLSYHAGMTTDMDASWVGLGWYLNPGAINRSVTNAPDDWKGGIGINYNSFYKETDYYGVTVEVGLPGAASVGVGLNWGGGQGLSGSVSATLGIGAGTGNTVQGGVSASVTTTGDASLSAGLGVSYGSYGAGASVSYSLKSQWNLSGGVTYGIGEEGASVGASYSAKGGFGITGSGDNDVTATNDKGVKTGGNSGGIGMSANSFSQGDASVDVQSAGIAVPFHFIGIPITLGFRKTKVKINIRKGFINQEWGSLYSNNYNYANNVSSINDVENYNELFTDYVERTRSLDTYSTRLPQSEEQFIGDYSKVIENINFTFMGYDNYNVAAQGLMGNMTPHVFQNATIFGKGERTTDGNGVDIHAFWHHGTNTNAVQRQLGRLNGTDISYNKNDFYFNFDGQFTSIEKNDVVGINLNSTNTALKVNDLINEGVHSGSSNDANNSYYGRAKSPNYIEVFTNRQIGSGYAASRGLISPANILNSDRNNIAKFDPDGIGGYKITSPDGKTYHFALPVYHFEQVQRGQIDEQENDVFNINNVNEKRQYTRYATHWLLTAVTGSDFVDRPDPNNGNVEKTFNKEDYGYWVELEYGKWTDGFVWRSPYQDREYEYNTNIKGQIEDKDKGGYSFGRKQLYYLDKINTRNRTALFVKDIRYDDIGKNLKFKFDNSNNGGGTNLGSTIDASKILNATNANVYVKEDKERNDGTGRRGVEYDREYSLKLSKIILVDGDVGKNLSKNSSGSLYSNNGYTPNGTCKPNWESVDFEAVYGLNYSYPIHNEQGVLDSNDINPTFIQNNALKVVELNHSYKLAKNSPSSKYASNMTNNPNTALGRLTLDSVQMKGKGGSSYMPATSFDYYMENMPNITLPQVEGGMAPTNAQIQAYIEQKKNMVDGWGYLQGVYNGDNAIKAWSLKSITMPTGAKIEIDYEEDNYWTEAFARKYWENDLSFQTSVLNGKIRLQITNFSQINQQNWIDFSKYFELNKEIFFDLWICHRYKASNIGGRYPDKKIDISPNNPNYNVKVISVESNNLVLESNYQNSSDVNNHDGTIYSIGFGTNVYYEKPRGHCPEVPEGHHNRHTMKYKLLANKVPENENGGGLRVKELRTLDNSNTYKVTYDYNHPTENRSSGITSYAPSDGVKYIPYQSEIPGPGVMYEYVTMKETSSTGAYDSKTRYRHHVLKPVFDIFNPNIKMEALDASATGEDNIFWANVIENYGGLNGNNARNVNAKKIDININTALIGQIKSIENLNSENQVILKTVNEYINGTKLVSKEPNKGYTKETFNSMKTVFKSNPDGTVITDAKRLLSISSKTEYNNMLKKSITISGGHKTYTEYSDVDPWLSSFRKSETTMADGTKMQSIRYPAYEKYTGMQSKVLNPNNKNMLNQEAMNISNVKVNGQWLTTNANVTTWKDNWSHVTNNGQTNTLGGLWRKHQNFVWKDNVDTNGTYGQEINTNSFNWNLGAIQTNTQWQKVSEITKYTLWSLPVETMDINGNFSASRMADNFSKTIATSNARYNDMYYCGAEYVDNGNLFEGEVLGANYRTQQQAHTGKWSVKNNTLSDKIFEINKAVSANTTANAISPGNYRVSFWVKENNAINNSGVTLTSNGVIQTVSETVEAGCWKQYNYYINIPLLVTNLNLDVKAVGTVDNYFDDFRMHPVSSGMFSYVYNQNTDELTAILGANNMASVFCYDAAGRLCTTYTEVAKQGDNIGGFKATTKNKYNYQDISNNNAGCDCIVEYCNDPDIDKDGVLNINDNCPNDFNTNQADDDTDGIGDVCDTFKDKDADGIMDSVDNCPTNYNPYQQDDDLDKIGNACDPFNDVDIDNDGILTTNDNCPTTSNPNQTDIDGDNIGDVCDGDIDGDGILNGSDFCPAILHYEPMGSPNNDDTDNDGIGDYCDCDSFVGSLGGTGNNLTSGGLQVYLKVYMAEPYFRTIIGQTSSYQVFDPNRYKFEWSELNFDGTFTPFVVGNRDHQFGIASQYCDANQQVYGPKYAVYCRVTDLYTNCQAILFKSNCYNP